MKMLIAAAAAMTAVASVAEELKTLTEEDREFLRRDYSSMSDADKARRDELAKLRFLIDEGGEMVRPGTPRGHILVVNKQKRVPVESIRGMTVAFQGTMEYDIRFSDADGDAAIVLRIIDDPKAQPLSIYPDAGRVDVNVAALAADNPKPAFLGARVRKELLRGFAYITGGSSYGTPLFGKIKSVKDLDDIADDGFPIDIMLRATKYLGGAGVRPKEVSTYRGVISKGFDIAPTNGYQKAIYEKVKAKMSFADRRKKYERIGR